jgi:anti-anti-sigma factor
VPERPPEPFHCDVEPAGDHVAVIPHGEVDLATVDELSDRLREVTRNGARHVVLDLRDVTFMDSSGLRLVMAWVDETNRDGMSLRLVPGPPHVQRLFEVTGMLDRMPWVSGP